MSFSSYVRTQNLFKMPAQFKFLFAILLFYAQSLSGQSIDYWKVDSTNQYRPRIEKGEYYRNNNYSLTYQIADSLFLHYFRREEKEVIPTFSTGQKSLFYWYMMNLEMRYGGFANVYLSDSWKYIPHARKGLKYLGQTELVKVLEKADSIYLQNEQLFEKGRKYEFMGNAINNKLVGFESLNANYDSLFKEVIINIEAKIRANPSEYCLNEHGDDHAVNFTGALKVFDHWNN